MLKKVGNQCPNGINFGLTRPNNRCPFDTKQTHVKDYYLKSMCVCVFRNNKRILTLQTLFCVITFNYTNKLVRGKNIQCDNIVATLLSLYTLNSLWVNKREINLQTVWLNFNVYAHKIFDTFCFRSFKSEIYILIKVSAFCNRKIEIENVSISFEAVYETK